MKKEINTSKEQDKLENSVATLFSKIYTSDEKQIINELDNRQIIVFVILWSIFERECINKPGESKPFDISRFVRNNHDRIDPKIIKERFDYFNKRYRNSIENYYSLISFSHCYDSGYIDYKGKKYETRDIFNENSPEPNLHEERLLFLLYIIYRFRCNIFHGNKSVFDWENNKKPINICCKALIQIIENVHPRNLT